MPRSIWNGTITFGLVTVPEAVAHHLRQPHGKPP
jgi:non-homologous end joining protein Ku